MQSKVVDSQMILKACTISFKGCTINFMKNIGKYLISFVCAKQLPEPMRSSVTFL